MSLAQQTKTTFNSPLFIVGMPRSGSTIFTRLLNESSDLFIINDCYYLQYVDSINGFSRKDKIVNNQLAQYLFNKIKARIERPNSPSIGCGLMLSTEDEQKIAKFVSKFSDDDKQNWSLILEQIMQFSASLLGKKTWGYNTPQDYLNIDLLFQAYPHAKFIFMMRDPRSMLRSYKYIFTNARNTTQRYHPVLQALAWRTSIRSYFEYKTKYPENILLIRYEDLVAQTNETLAKVGDFVNVQFPNISLDQFGNNSSFKDKSSKNINDTEVWLCEKVAGEEMKQIRYNISESKPHFRDAEEVILLTLNAASFYFSKSLTSNDIRKRLLKLAKKVFRLAK